MRYGIHLGWNRLCEDPQALNLIQLHLPTLEQMIERYPGMGRISIRAVCQYAPAGLFPQDRLFALDKALSEYGKSLGRTADEEAKITKYQTIAKEDSALALTVHPSEKRAAFYPGKPWYDTSGRRIQAHGGAVYYEDGVYYWYGENKTYTDGKNPIWTWGIRVYRSQDLYNWEDCGQLVMPVLDDPDSNLFPECYADRPHIIKSRSTGMYVMWIKISGSESCFVILQSESLLGPYEIVTENYYPLDHSVGDFDLVLEDKTGKAYLFLDTNHQFVGGLELAEDCLSVKCQVSTQYEHLLPPFSREGIAVFEHLGKKYMITSGHTGYTPNQSEYAVADCWAEPFRPVGDPHVDDDTLSSFNSQISQIFKVPGKKDLYIAVADRWMPNHLLDREIALSTRRAIASKYMPEQYKASQADRDQFEARPDIERANTSVADYVWLPVTFDGDQICIQWYDSWRLEDFGSM